MLCSTQLLKIHTVLTYGPDLFEITIWDYKILSSCCNLRTIKVLDVEKNLSFIVKWLGANPNLHASDARLDIASVLHLMNALVSFSSAGEESQTHGLCFVSVLSSLRWQWPTWRDRPTRRVRAAWPAWRGGSAHSSKPRTPSQVRWSASPSESWACVCLLFAGCDFQSFFIKAEMKTYAEYLLQ